MVYYLFAVSGVRSASPPDSHHQTFIFSVNDNMTTDNMMLKSTIMLTQYCELPPCPRLAGGNNLPSNTTRVSTVTEPGRTLENYPPPLRIRSVQWHLTIVWSTLIIFVPWVLKAKYLLSSTWFQYSSICPNQSEHWATSQAILESPNSRLPMVMST